MLLCEKWEKVPGQPAILLLLTIDCFTITINEQVILGSMGALSLMTVLSVVIGRIFNSVPAQFQTSQSLVFFPSLCPFLLYL